MKIKNLRKFKIYLTKKLGIIIFYFNQIIIITIFFNKINKINNNINQLLLLQLKMIKIIIMILLKTINNQIILI